MAPTKEEKLIAQVAIPSLSEWTEGRRFMIMDDRAAYIFDSDVPNASNSDGLLEGRVISYTGIDSRITPGGSQERVVLFSDGTRVLKYPTGLTPEMADSSIHATDIPLLLDLSTVVAIDSLLQGRRLWTRSNLWYDAAGMRRNGRKFVPVTALGVEAGNRNFPCRVIIEDENGALSYIYMNIDNNTRGSRSFPSVFSLSDPKERYPTVDPEIWSLIQQGKVRIGMTKEECKLSLGNPDDVDAGRDWTQSIDLWHYSDGRWLRFADGILADFRL